jgi:hypothetical protein
MINEVDYEELGKFIESKMDSKMSFWYTVNHYFKIKYQKEGFYLFGSKKMNDIVDIAGALYPNLKNFINDRWMEDRYIGRRGD